jgi:hypothetical protein
MPKELKISTTVVIPVNDRDWLVRLARVTGHMRTNPQTRKIDGNLSWAMSEAISFLRSHYQQYQREQGERLAEEMSGGNNDEEKEGS